jgi:hypothetical protein
MKCKEAAKEHHAFLGKRFLGHMGEAAQIEMIIYKRFLSEANQFVSYRKKQPLSNEINDTLRSANQRTLRQQKM